jgi:chromosomal replication initiation ATPase DnaA
LKKLKEQVPATTYGRLKDTLLLKLEQNTAYVLVANRMAREWLERRMYWGIYRTLRDVLQQEVTDVQFVTAA